MKLGLGLYRGLLTDSNFKFARQCGVTHIAVHLVDYFGGASPRLSRGRDDSGWGITDNRGKLWTVDELREIKSAIESHGLVWEAIENFDPAHWHDILLDGPEKQRQMEDLKTIIRNVGEVGIPIVGYNFSIAGVWGWTKGPTGRGDAVSVQFEKGSIDHTAPIPNGMVWNMTYDPEAPAGVVPPVTPDALWDRCAWFLQELVPVAEEAGVTLAAHPDDPPVETLRRTARLVNAPHKYQRLLDLAPSPANQLEFCMGTVQEMAEGDLCESLARYASQGKLAYVHARNVKGKVPRYREVFIDEGDIDMRRALRVLAEHDFDGMIVPDHTPEMRCDAPWHAGMAFALGYLRCALEEVAVG